MPMVPIAPRYDPSVVELIHALDDRNEPIAETCRRVGRAAGRLGLWKPSYAHVRRFVLAERERQDAERERRDAIKELVAEAAFRTAYGQLPNPYTILDRYDRIRRRFE